MAKKETVPEQNITIGARVGEKPTKEKLITITYRENRKFDLHVGRDMVTFGPRETKSIPVSWLKHRDFAQAKKYFIIKGV